MMKTSKPVHFVPGPTIKPSDVLLDWLNGLESMPSGSRKRLRIPVVVRFEDAYRFAIGEAFIGSSEKDCTKESILLSLDDSGMDIPLLSILRDLCPEQLEACAFWLEGLWGSLLQPDLPELVGLDNKGAVMERRFAVLKVDGIVQEQTDAIRIFVEEETPDA